MPSLMLLMSRCVERRMTELIGVKRQKVMLPAGRIVLGIKDINLICHIIIIIIFHIAGLMVNAKVYGVE